MIEVGTEGARRTHTVKVADMKASGELDVVLVTHALGSCLGVTLHDPVAGVGGMAHLMLPLARLNPARAEERPFMFVDVGFPALYEEVCRLGGRRDRMVIKVAGGARILDEGGQLRIGPRNIAILRKLLWKNGLLIEAEDVGGTASRTMSFEVETGRVTIKSNGRVREL